MAEEQSVIVISTSEPLLQVAEENNSSGSTSGTTVRSNAAVGLQDQVKGLQSILEISWNLILIIVSIAMLLSTREESPTTPIRLWIMVFAIQCLIDVVLIVLGFSWNVRSCNNMIAFVWWIFGVCWVASGGSLLMHNAPHLYWLAVVLLSFRAFVALIICVCIPCCICCCIPFLLGST